MAELADSYTERNRDGSYGNIEDAFLATGCADGPPVGTVSDVWTIEAAAAQAAPRLGRSIVNNSVACALWPVKGAPAAPVHARADRRQDGLGDAELLHQGHVVGEGPAPARLAAVELPYAHAPVVDGSSRCRNAVELAVVRSGAPPAADDAVIRRELVLDTTSKSETPS